MDIWNQLVFAPGAFKKQVIPTAVCNGHVKPKVEEFDSFSDEEDAQGLEYVKEYQLKELASHEDAIFNHTKTGTMSMVSDNSTQGLDVHDDNMDGTGSDANPMSRTETVNRIYSGYTFIKPIRASLPIDTVKEDILNTLEVTSVVIIEGATGCGKTTRVPQFIIDQYWEAKEYCNIVVTQPRKLAAISVAKHVSEERGWDVGSIIGYQVGLDRVTSPDTILTYMTVGVLLQKIIERKNLNDYTHIIVDEVHERSQEMDFLFIILRRFLNTNSLGVKLILMSATFDTTMFADYFKTTTDGVGTPAWRIDVKKPMIYDKSIHYIEELGNLGNVEQNFNIDVAQISRDVYDIFVRLVLALKHLDRADAGMGHVLVFLPGIFEIEQAYSLLMAESKKGRGDFMIVPLHSSIPAHEQGRVFAKPAPNVRKVILSTNIAESSITVPDVKYVIDFCLTKLMTVDVSTQYQTLRLAWASRTNCVQRAGRVGRVSSGRVYRLVRRAFYEREMRADVVPEMLRAPLERVVLFSKRLELAELPQSILALAMSPPDLRDIRTTIKLLKEVGALLLTCRGAHTEADGDVTMLGTIMCSLPIDVKLAKLICLGYMFSLMEECVIMAAGCSLPNLFATPFADRMHSYANKMLWADGSCSDLYAHLTLYQTYRNNKSAGTWRSVQEEKRWCALNYVSYRSLKEWEALVEELKQRLEQLQLRPARGAQYVAMNDAERALVLKVIIAGAFYPNYFARSCDAGQVDEREVCKVLQGLDQYSTVYFTHMPPNQPGPLYEQRIRDLVGPVSKDVNVYFGHGSSNKVYVSFLDKRTPAAMTANGRTYVAFMPGKINVDVYKAVKMRQLRSRMTFPIMDSALAWQLAVQQGIATTADGLPRLVAPSAKKMKQSVTPRMWDNAMKIKISYTIDAGHFYAYEVNAECERNLQSLLALLNNAQEPLKPADGSTLQVGDLYAAQYEGAMYRCCVQAILPFGDHQVRVHVVFIDYGNTASVAPNELYRLPAGLARHLAPLTMECTLSGVQPVGAFNPRGVWADKANEYFHSCVEDAELDARVFSVVGDVVSVELFGPLDPKSLNERLVEQGWAERREESFLSKEDHDQRLACKATAAAAAGDGEGLLDVAPKPSARLVAAPCARECTSMVELRGPYSPLEMKVYAMNRSQARVAVESGSINCVLLDHQPEDPHERLLVATSISASARGDALTVRHTTLMPATRGLSALMPLIFAPKVLFKASHDGASYASALCGLGVGGNRKPVYAEHDICVVFDVAITQEDIVLVNEIRYIMNRLTDVMRMNVRRAQDMQHSYHQMLKARLMKLLTVQRESKERKPVLHADSWTKNDYVGTLLAPAGNCSWVDDIWPLHSVVDLLPRDENAMLQMHLNELASYTRRCKEMTSAVTCKFCSVQAATLSDLCCHMCTQVHIDNVKRFQSQSDETNAQTA